MKVMISGGGTGGHVYPAIAIANALREANPDVEIMFVGAQGKMEMEAVPKAGYPIEGLWISGLQRGQIVKNLLLPFKILHSLWKSWQLIRQFKPDVAVGVGGYASAAVLFMANQMGIPTLIQEQNSFAGMTNKMLADKVRLICTAYDGMEKYFPANKIRLLGNPVRQDIVDLADKRVEACQHFGFKPEQQIVFLFGGSLGARTLNESLKAQVDLLAEHPEIQVLWQAGKLNYEAYRECDSAKLPNVQIRAFIDRMDLAYAMADLVVARAGALTISELCLVGKPAILVPSPNVAEDHQTHNAMALVTKSAALMVRDREAKEKLVPQMLSVLKNAELRKQLSEHVLKLGKPNAAKDIAQAVGSLINER